MPRREGRPILQYVQSCDSDWVLKIAAAVMEMARRDLYEGDRVACLDALGFLSLESKVYVDAIFENSDFTLIDFLGCVPEDIDRLRRVTRG